MPENTFYSFKFRFLNIARASEFVAFQVIDKSLEGDETSPVKKTIEEDEDFIWRMGKGKGIEMTMQNAINIIQKAGLSVWFPVQKNAAKLMGDIKVNRWGLSLISQAQINDFKSLLRPGDILLQRREWYLSNLGLPGFWTHAALYIGTSSERKVFFGSDDLENELRRRHPESYSKSLTRDIDGHSPRVIEAIAEGVSFTTIEHSASADSMVVIRPRLSKSEIAEAIALAFDYSGLPYDFNFDFLTDSSLVCSELIYKVYEPTTNSKGITFPLAEIMGKNMVIPNGIAEQFDKDYGTEKQQFDMVLFMDGYEKENKAIESNILEFRDSWKRPKWHIFIQDQAISAKQKSLENN